MKAQPDPADVWLYQKALICKSFPAYKLEELDTVPIVPIMQAMQLLNLAQQALS